VRRRLILSTALIAFAAVVVLGVPLGLVEAARLRQDTTDRLEHEADAAFGAVEDRLEGGGQILPSDLRRFVGPRHRIVVVTRAGRRIATGPPLGGRVVTARAGSSGSGHAFAQARADEVNDRLNRAWMLIGALGLGGVLIAVVLSALQSRRLARPLEAVARGSAQLGDGDFSVRVGHFGIPEIDAIAQGLDSSAARIAQLVAREREFSANVSHQLRTPLTALRLRLEGVGAEDDAARRAGELDAALAETDRLEATISALLAHARQTTGASQIRVDLARIANEHAAIWRPVFARAGRRLEIAARPGTAAQASRGTVGQILDVLLDNALRHGIGTARIEVTAGDGAACIAVVDGGPGIGTSDRDRIFERGASRSGGTGIGLQLARALAQADGGTLRAAEGAPTRFELRLPSHAP
jgi:signal transduction histidine kinase